jgi:hypothetical protein
VCPLSALFLQKVFCGHEHTLSNLEFAQKVEPCNDHVRAKLSWAQVWPLLAPSPRMGVFMCGEQMSSSWGLGARIQEGSHRESA